MFGIALRQHRTTGVDARRRHPGQPTARVRDDQPTITGPGETTYVYEALDAGTYTFICSVHPIPAMTGTLTVE